MDFNLVEELTNEQINDLYSEIIEEDKNDKIVCQYYTYVIKCGNGTIVNRTVMYGVCISGCAYLTRANCPNTDAYSHNANSVNITNFCGSFGAYVCENCN